MGDDMDKGLACTIDGALRSVYRFCAGLSAVFLLLILLTILLQMTTRWVRIDLLGVSEYAGYFMSISAFLMAPQALISGTHIRMDLFLTNTSGVLKKIIFTLCLLVANAVAIYVAYYAVKAVQISHMIGERSQGIDATPLWIPQLGMGFGMTLFAIAMAHFSILYFVRADTTLETPTEA